MSKRLNLLAFALTAALSAAPALADPPTGSRLGKHTLPGREVSEREQAVGAKKLASCLYNRKKGLATELLLAQTKEGADRVSSRLLGEVQCFSATFSNELVAERHVNFPADILRGMLSEAALESTRAAVAMLQPLPLQLIYERSWYAVTGRHVSVDEMGACIADTNPAGIAGLIRTVPTTKEENAAFAALRDSMVKCLRAGTRLQASRQALRAALADALFQRIHRPEPVAATAEAAKQ